MSGRTYWLKKDGAWWERGAVRRARKEFGPTGPAVMDWLECAARRQNAGGRVKADPFTIAEDIGSEEVTVCHVVSHLVQKNWLVSHEADGDLFKAKIAWYEADQRRGDDAERKAESRANPPNSEDLSRSVTESHLREEKRREEQKEETALSASPTDSGSSLIVAELFAYWQQQTKHPTAMLKKDRRAKVEARLREGYTPDQIRRGIDGAARAAYVDEAGKRFDDLELICRNSVKLEDFIDRATAAANGNGNKPAHIPNKYDEAVARKAVEGR
jgi:hypothetical protein